MASSLPNWHYTTNGQQVGPVSESEIRGLINSGVVVASTLVWREGMTDWLPANQSTLSKLFSGSAPPQLLTGLTQSASNGDIEKINSLGVPCYFGSCSELYLEKAFDDTNFRPTERLPVAKELGETSMMFLVHPTLTIDEIQQTCDAISIVIKLASK